MVNKHCITTLTCMGYPVVCEYYLGHPIRIQFRNGHVIKNVYAADGRKLREKHITAIDGLTMQMGHTLELTPAQTMAVDSMDYADNLHFRKQRISSSHVFFNLDYHFDGGYLSVTPPASTSQTSYNMTSHFFIRDHQGNNCLVVDGSDNIKLYLGSGNTLYWPNAAMNINAFRAYFQLNDQTGNGVRAFNLNFDGEEITSIHNSQFIIHNEADAWYDLSGRKLNGKPSQRGIYVNNGKKVVVK